jgi:hypothetical protein
MRVARPFAGSTGPAGQMYGLPNTRAGGLIGSAPVEGLTSTGKTPVHFGIFDITNIHSIKYL